MANMANIVVKKANGTTDITYTALTASAGDTVPARWRENSQASVVGFRPTLTQVARANGNNNARVVTTRFKFPVVRAVGGVDTVVVSSRSSSLPPWETTSRKLRSTRLSHRE